MSVVQVRLPDEVQQIIDRQVAEGRVSGMDEFLAEAARRYAVDLDLGDELVAEGKAGIADIEAGRYRTLSIRAELAAMETEAIARVRDRLAADRG